MKKIFVLSVLTSLAMICACQKKDSAAQEQPTQPKTELVAREEGLAERLNSLEEKVNRLDQRVKELTEKEDTAASARARRPDVQDQISDPAQLEAQRQRIMQQLSTMMPDPSKVQAGDPTKQERRAPRQLSPQDLQRQWQQKLDKAKMSGKAVFPAPEAGSPSPSPAEEVTSPSPSPTPQ